MVELERPEAATEGSISAGSSLLIAFAKLLLHGFVVTGIFLAYTIVSNWFMFSWWVSFEGLIILFLAFGILEGLVNRKVSQTLWSVRRKSVLVDILVRGPILFAISIWITMSVVPVMNLAGPPQYLSPLAVIFMFALLFAIASPFNGLAGFVIASSRFGVPKEIGASSAPTGTLGTCPFCQADYSYSPEQIVDGQARCQNCDRPFLLVGEGPSVG